MLLFKGSINLEFNYFVQDREDEVRELRLLLNGSLHLVAVFYKLFVNFADGLSLLESFKGPLYIY